MKSRHMLRMAGPFVTAGAPIPAAPAAGERTGTTNAPDTGGMML